MDAWPFFARSIATLRTTDDKGLGDTVARCLTIIGAKSLAHVYHLITGKSCGCVDRQAKLNEMYPYAQS